MPTSSDESCSDSWDSVGLVDHHLLTWSLVHLFNRQTGRQAYSGGFSLASILMDWLIRSQLESARAADTFFYAKASLEASKRMYTEEEEGIVPLTFGCMLLFCFLCVVHASKSLMMVLRKLAEAACQPARDWDPPIIFPSSNSSYMRRPCSALHVSQSQHMLYSSQQQK